MHCFLRRVLTAQMHMIRRSTPCHQQPASEALLPSFSEKHKALIRASDAAHCSNKLKRFLLECNQGPSRRQALTCAAFSPPGQHPVAVCGQLPPPASFGLPSALLSPPGALHRTPPAATCHLRQRHAAGWQRLQIPCSSQLGLCEYLLKFLACTEKTCHQLPCMPQEGLTRCRHAADDQQQRQAWYSTLLPCPGCALAGRTAACISPAGLGALLVLAGPAGPKAWIAWPGVLISCLLH